MPADPGEAGCRLEIAGVRVDKVAVDAPPTLALALDAGVGLDAAPFAALASVAAETLLDFWASGAGEKYLFSFYFFSANFAPTWGAYSLGFGMPN